MICLIGIVWTIETQYLFYGVFHIECRNPQSQMQIKHDYSCKQSFRIWSLMWFEVYQACICGVFATETQLKFVQQAVFYRKALKLNLNAFFKYLSYYTENIERTIISKIKLATFLYKGYFCNFHTRWNKIFHKWLVNHRCDWLHKSR